MKITAKTQDGKVHSLEVSPSEKIENIKATLAEKEDINPDCLTIIHNGETLTNAQLLSDLDIKEDTILWITKEYAVFIKTVQGDEIPIRLPNLDITGKELKKRLFEVNSTYKIENQILYASTTKINDTETLASQGIENCQTIHIVINLKGGEIDC